MNEKLVSVEGARSALRSIRATDTHITMRRGDTAAFFHTIIAQSEQIKRLQGVIRNLDAGGGGDLINSLAYSGVLTYEDMEDPDD